MAHASYEAALAFVLHHEGGFADNPADPGGATQFGITRATLAAWRGRPVSRDDVRTLSPAEAGAIYRARYWQAIDGDNLPAGIDLIVFDAAVNSGPGRALRWLQDALEVPADGILGPVSRAALARSDGTAVIRAFTRQRQAFVEALPTFRTFGRGWSRRIRAAEKAGLALAVNPARDTAPLPPPAAQANPETTMILPTLIAGKSLLASRTLWANAIGLIALVLSWFGFETSGIDSGGLADAMLQAIAGLGFVASTVFRVLATRRLVA